MARERPDDDIEVLASEIRALRPFGVLGVTPWLRANLDLIDALQLASWIPASGSVQAGRWTYIDIARAIDRAGISYEEKPVAWKVLKARICDIRGDNSKKQPAVASLTSIREIVQDVVDDAFRRHQGVPVSRPAAIIERVEPIKDLAKPDRAVHAEPVRPSDAEISQTKDRNPFRRPPEPPLITVRMESLKAVEEALNDLEKAGNNGR